MFVALMKKIYLGWEEGAELLSSLSPVLRSPDKGAGIIFNTVPFTGHISGDSAATERHVTARGLQMNHDSEQ